MDGPPKGKKTTKSSKWTDPQKGKIHDKCTKWTDPLEGKDLIKGPSILVLKVDGPKRVKYMTSPQSGRTPRGRDVTKGLKFLVHKIDEPPRG